MINVKIIKKNLIFILLFSILNCSSGNNMYLIFDEPKLDESNKRSGSISGKVLDTTKSEINGATVTITNTAGSFSNITLTNSNGDFSFPTLPEAMNEYIISVSMAGYNTATKNNVSVVANTNTDVGIIFIVSTSASPGTLTGTVIDSYDGAIIQGATIEIIRYDDVIADTLTSGLTGGFTSIILSPGSYTIRVYKTGFFDLLMDNRIVDGNQNLYYLPLCEILTGNQIRVFVLWGTAPQDLDLHVTGPTGNANTGHPLWDGSPTDRFHIYYDDHQSWDEAIGEYYNIPGQTTSLVQDSTSGIGPETINFTGPYDYGIYTFTVNNFSSTDWGGGEYMPVVRVYDSLGLVQEIPFPSNYPTVGEKKWYWKVCKINIQGPTRADRTTTIPTTDQFWDNGWNEDDKALMDW